jgi:hypothetical protein
MGTNLYLATWENELGLDDFNSMTGKQQTDAVKRSNIMQEVSGINASIGAPAQITPFTLAWYPTPELQMAASEAYYQVAIERIKNNPASYAWHVISSWWRLWHTEHYPAAVPAVFRLALKISSIVVYVLGFAGGIFALRGGIKSPLVAPFLFLLYFPLVHCWLHTEARYTAGGRLILIFYASLMAAKVFQAVVALWFRRVKKSGPLDLATTNI